MKTNPKQIKVPGKVHSLIKELAERDEAQLWRILAEGAVLYKEKHPHKRTDMKKVSLLGRPKSKSDGELLAIDLED